LNKFPHDAKKLATDPTWAARTNVLSPPDWIRPISSLSFPIEWNMMASINKGAGWSFQCCLFKPVHLDFAFGEQKNFFALYF
jgi:hypothetical protein